MRKFLSPHVPLVREPLKFQYVEIRPVIALLQRLPYLSRRVVHYGRRLTLHRGRHRGGGAREKKLKPLTDLDHFQHLEMNWIEESTKTIARYSVPGHRDLGGWRQHRHHPSTWHHHSGRVVGRAAALVKNVSGGVLQGKEELILQFTQPGNHLLVVPSCPA